MQQSSTSYVFLLKGKKMSGYITQCHDYKKQIVNITFIKFTSDAKHSNSRK